MVSDNCALDMAPPWLAVTTLSADRGPLQLSDRFPTSAHRTKLAIGGPGASGGRRLRLKPMDHYWWQKDAAARWVREQNPDDDYLGPRCSPCPPSHAASEKPW